MTLNKNTGLYALPSHHLHGGQHVPLPTFNSLDFGVDDVELEPRDGNDVTSAPQEKKDAKTKKKKHTQVQTQDSDGTPAARTRRIAVTPVTARAKGKKRKRESEEGSFRRASGDAGSFLVGAEMLRNVESSVKAAREAFGSRPAMVQREEAGKAGNKIKQDKQDKANRQSTDTLDFDLMAKETRRMAKAVKKENKARRRSAARVQAGEAVSRSSPPVFSSQPRKTPVPVPQKGFSQLPTPIPFRLGDAIKAKRGEEARTAVDKRQADSRVSLTTSNLVKYTTTTQPLSGEPKPRPMAVSRAASTADSTTSGGTTASMKRLLTHVGKPYSGPGEVAEAGRKKRRELHQEADFDDFTARYKAAQKAVNFSDEREYLSAFVSWRKANSARGLLPCLGIKASGCNSKKEEMLRLKGAEVRSQDEQRLQEAQQGAAAADALLALAVAARVPVPIGRVEGVWKLYCPAYSATHVDRYGYGQRTLSLFSVAGSASPVAYTARLSIPPRSMLFSMVPFEAPAHASFRGTVVMTSVEEYKMEIYFLGNGYLVLRADLRLLLSGKEGRTSEGKRVVMEFVGVHEGAVEWGEREDEVEAVGRRLFEKYDGGW